MLHRVLELFFGETLHSLNVFLLSACLEIWNGNFSKINDQETLNLVPVLNISFWLSNSFKKNSLCFSFIILGLKHSFESKFTFTKFIVCFSVSSNSFNGILFSRLTGFFLSNSLGKCIQIENLTFNPISYMFKWVIESLC